MKKRTTWTFEGTVLLYEKVATRNYIATTVAGSYEEAYRNIVFRWKNEMGLTVHCKVTLDGNLYRVDPKPYKSKADKSPKYDYEQIKMNL